MFLQFQEIPISVKYLRKFIFLLPFQKYCKNGEANYNDKEFYYIGQTFRFDDKDYIAIASAKITM